MTTTFLTKVARANTTIPCPEWPNLGLKEAEDTLLDALKTFGWAGALKFGGMILLFRALDQLMHGLVELFLAGLPR
ncbi:hypothetical protein N7540_000640 [Penicillium herquei]|nr:hypothetical protein N7540_000640 [Penicillium herquei]